MKKGEIILKGFSPLEVKVYDNDVERAMRILKKKIQNDGLFRRLKLKRSYEKPSERRRRKWRENEKKRRMNQKKSNKRHK